MKFRRNLFIILAVLSGMVTILLAGTSLKIDMLFARLTCSPLAELEGYCDSSESADVDILRLVGIVFTGGLMMVLFVFYARRETQLLRQQHKLPELSQPGQKSPDAAVLLPGGSIEQPDE
ncbi:MAG: hypothetical protein JW966_04470 [Anaerolineae bacterium]|nr:hypothetical protein [Anaerolineae bacterium]